MVKNPPAHTGDVRDVGSIPGSISREPAPVSSPGESLDCAGGLHSHWGREESDTTGAMSRTHRVHIGAPYRCYSVNVKFRRIFKNFLFGYAVGLCMWDLSSSTRD